MRGSVLFVQRKLSERYDFNNVLASKTASSVVEKKIDVNIQFYKIEVLHELLDIAKMSLLNTVWTILNIILTLCSHKSFQYSIVLRRRY